MLDEEDRIVDEIAEGGGERVQRIVGVGARRKHRFTAYKGGAGQEGQRFDRLVKTGYCKKNESLGFTNYFLAQKVRAKVTTTDETEGTKLILGQGKDAKKDIVTTKAGVKSAKSKSRG